MPGNTPRAGTDLQPPPSPELQPWTVLSRRTLVADRWLRLHVDQVRTGRGVVLDTFYVIGEADWACAVPVLADGRIVVVEQFRHGVQTVTWELPAGDLDAGEDPATGALRELREETGYVPRGEPQPLGAFWPEPSRNGSRGHCFLIPVAADPGMAQPDAAEDIRLHLLDIASVDAAIAAGKFAHAVHVAAVLLARAHMGRLS